MCQKKRCVNMQVVECIAFEMCNIPTHVYLLDADICFYALTLFGSLLALRSPHSM